MNITENEMKVLLALLNNHFANEPGEWIWANCINDSKKPSGLEGKNLSAVVGSLYKKKLAELDGTSGRDACIRLTDAGIAAAQG